MTNAGRLRLSAFLFTKAKEALEKATAGSFVSAVSLVGAFGPGQTADARIRLFLSPGFFSLAGAGRPAGVGRDAAHHDGESTATVCQASSPACQTSESEASFFARTSSAHGMVIHRPFGGAGVVVVPVHLELAQGYACIGSVQGSEEMLSTARRRSFKLAA
jgi:hypothetical protein